MIDYTTLPAVNASLNAIAAVLLTIGWVFIRRGDRRRAPVLSCCRRWRPRRCSWSSYLVYHANVGSVPFQGQGAVRAIYFTILITHVVLAAAILPLAVMTLSRALAERFDRHRKIARWTLPIWMYVSVTGVVIYLMLYRM